MEKSLSLNCAQRCIEKRNTEPVTAEQIKNHFCKAW